MACTNKKIGHNNPRRVLMRKILLSLAAASALVAAASIAPASAMTVGTASGIQAAIDGTSAVEDVAYVCSHPIATTAAAGRAGGGRVAITGPIAAIIAGGNEPLGH
jgi:hypothetical protein